MTTSPRGLRAPMMETSQSNGISSSKSRGWVPKSAQAFSTSSGVLSTACPLPSYPNRRVLITAGRPMSRSARVTFQGTQCIHRDVFPVECQNFGACRELIEEPGFGKCAVEHRSHLSRRCIFGRIQKQEIQSERIARQSKHPAELASAHDSYSHTLLVVRGSGVSSTVAGCRSRKDSSAPLISGYLLARMAAAQSAALVAPATPIASVATGVPAGIWTIDNSESMPPSVFD